MTRRATLALATFALMLCAGTAHARQASLAVGAATPVGDFTKSAGAGIDVALQFRTDPMLGPVRLRIEIGYDHFAGKNAVENTSLSSQAVSFTGDFGSVFYWAAGPGYYQSTSKGTILGHQITNQFDYFGAQAALGMNIPLFRWQGFLEASAVKLFQPGPSIIYVPVRFGVHL
jgi:hypothetical protein